MTTAWHRSDMVASIRITHLLLLSVLLWSVSPKTIAAHGGEGLDAGFAHVIANTGSDGTTHVEVRISATDDCDKFWTGWLIAQRDTTSIESDFTQQEPCVLAGTVVLPERGRWMVTARLMYATQPTEIQIPVGFSGEPGTFERTDWLHVDAVLDQQTVERAWYIPSGALAYAVIGLLIGTAIELGRRRLVAKPR